MIDIRNFVNVNIKPYEQTREEGSRPQVLVYGAEDNVIVNGFNSDYSVFYHDGDKVELKENDKARATIFFKNGGSYLEFKTDSLPDVATLKNKKLIDNVIIVNASDTPSEITEEEMEELGIYKKFIVEKAISWSNYNKDNYIGGSYQAITISNELGAEMVLASYLSQIKVYESCLDYNFTEVQGIDEDLSDTIEYGNEGEPLTNIPFNFFMKVGNNVLNIGGNAVDGSPLVTTFVSIILTQTTTNAVFNVLKTKLSGNAGINKIRTALCEELNKYTNSGYLTTDEIWGYQDLVVKNALNTSSSETVITTNTPISNGYYIHIFKTTKTKEEVYIFLILATSKGIRYVKIDGRVL